MNHRKKSRRPANNGKSWSAEEDEIVMKSIDEGYTHGQVADLLDRTRGAVESRHCTLNQIRARVPAAPIGSGPKAIPTPASTPTTGRRACRVYVAGKIQAGGFRQGMVEGLEENGQPYDWGEEWPILENAIEGEFDYTGPFLVENCNHSRSGCSGDHGWMACDGDYEHSHIARLCRRAIVKSDVVFAWIDSNDCYGTLIEIGYAMGRGRPVFIAGPRKFDEMWFAYECASVGEDDCCPSISRCLLGSPSAASAFRELGPLIWLYAGRWERRRAKQS